MPVARNFERLLLLMHAVGYELSDSESLAQRVWGEHLLEDWRSLELLAQKNRVVITETVEP